MHFIFTFEELLNVMTNLRKFDICAWCFYVQTRSLVWVCRIYCWLGILPMKASAYLLPLVSTTETAVRHYSMGAGSRITDFFCSNWSHLILFFPKVARGVHVQICGYDFSSLILKRSINSNYVFEKLMVATDKRFAN